MELTSKEADKILNLVSGSDNPIFQKIDELICSIQSREEIEYVDDEEEGD